MMREEPVSEPKPKSFEISKWAVWEAYRRVKANKGAAGVDGESIQEFERDLSGTCTSSGIGSRRGAICPRRFVRWRYRRRTAAQGF